MACIRLRPSAGLDYWSHDGDFHLNTIFHSYVTSLRKKFYAYPRMKKSNYIAIIGSKQACYNENFFSILDTE